MVLVIKNYVPLCENSYVFYVSKISTMFFKLQIQLFQKS